MPPVGRQSPALGACKLMFMACPNGLVQPEPLNEMVSTSVVSVTWVCRAAREASTVSGTPPEAGRITFQPLPLRSKRMVGVAPDGLAACLLDAAAHFLGDGANVRVGQVTAHARQCGRREQA